MNTIISNKSNIIEINKSKFYNFIYKVESLDDILNILNDLKAKYKDATHICYAYKIGSKEKAYDDGEPSGTAGKPILDILKKHDLDYILAVTVRYFGGIKLGASNLLRAYANGINELIINNTTPLKDAYKVRFKIFYDKVNLIEKLNLKILYKEFDEDIIYEAIVYEEDLDKLKAITDTQILDKIKTS